MNILSLLPGAIKSIFSVIDDAVEDKDLANQLKNSVQMELITSAQKEVEAKKDIIVAEAQGESWLQRNWRPILMLTIVAIVANNYLIAPYLQAFFEVGLILELPSELFTLMTVGVGGYIVGRSGEKISKGLKK